MADLNKDRTLLGGEYRLIEVLDRTPTAEVWVAWSRSLEAEVAVKLIDRDRLPQVSLDRFRREAHLLAVLHHPNLIEVHFAGEDDGRGADGSAAFPHILYIVMRLAGGGTLTQLLRPGQPLGLVRTGRLVAQVGAALQHLNDADIVHRDVKPGNVLLGNAEWALLADMGIAQPESDIGDGTPIGTKRYMSPEQCLGNQVDRRSDQFSLAVMTYEMLTGTKPFDAQITTELQQQHLHGPKHPRLVSPGLPGTVADILVTALAREPKDRYAEVRDFTSALTTAIERARGVTSDTKRNIAQATPNLLSIMALVVLSPFLVGMLPAGAVIAGGVPLAWPFQYVLAVAIAALFLGIRGNVMALARRLVGWTVDLIDRVGTAPHGLLSSSAWRNQLVVAADGIVDLGFLLATFRLAVVPALVVFAPFFDATAAHLASIAVSVLLVLAALGVVLGIHASAGPVAAVAILALGWVAAQTLPGVNFGVTGGPTLAWAVQLLVGAGLMAVLVARRRQIQAQAAQLAVSTFQQLLADARPNASEAEATADRSQLVVLAGALVDFGLLLLSYALLRTPLVSGLDPLVGSQAAAVAVTGVAGLSWLVLAVRLWRVAGIVGATLGVLLGAPLVVSLPLLDRQLQGADWPATVVSWVVGTSVLFLLAALRGSLRTAGRQVLGVRLDRGLMGTQVAADEAQSATRAGALGRLADALIDVGLLVVAYWVLEAPLTSALTQLTGMDAVGSLLLAGLLATSVGILISPLRHANAVLNDTGGAHWRTRGRALVGLVLAIATLVVVGGAVTPRLVIGPDVPGEPPLQPSRVPLLVVDSDFWLPNTPGVDLATYTLALSCTDGRRMGEFREAYRPPAGAPMPSGTVGPLGRSGVPCDDWQAAYAARRRAAGLTDAPSSSWEWLDVHAVINPDESVDVVETHRLLFSAGSHTDVMWHAGTDESGVMSDLDVSEAGVHFPLGQDTSKEPYARMSDAGGQQWIEWRFPEVNAPSERTYTVKYRLTGAVQASGETRRSFERTVLAADRNQVVWRATVQVQLPARFEAEDVRVGAVGASAQSGIVDGQSAWFTVQDVPPEQGLVLGVDFPADPSLARITLRGDPNELPIQPLLPRVTFGRGVTSPATPAPIIVIVPPTDTPMPPTPTPVPPTPTALPPTATPAPATSTPGTPTPATLTPGTPGTPRTATPGTPLPATPTSGTPAPGTPAPATPAPSAATPEPPFTPTSPTDVPPAPAGSPAPSDAPAAQPQGSAASASIEWSMHVPPSALPECAQLDIPDGVRARAVANTVQVAHLIDQSAPSHLVVVAYTAYAGPVPPPVMTLTISLPEGLALAPGQQDTCDLPLLTTRFSSVSWLIDADPAVADTTLTYTIDLQTAGAGRPQHVTLRRSVTFPSGEP